MALPLLPLLASQGVKLIGAHSLRSLATQQMFNLGEKALLSKSMPGLGTALSLGSSFVPGRSAVPGSLLSGSPASIGKMLGQADVLQDLLGKAVSLAPGAPGFLGLASQVGSLCKVFEKDLNPTKFLSALSVLRPLTQTAMLAVPALAGVAGGVMDMFDKLLQQGPQQAPQVSADSPQMTR